MTTYSHNITLNDSQYIAMQMLVFGTLDDGKFLGTDVDLKSAAARVKEAMADMKRQMTSTSSACWPEEGEKG